MSIITIMAIIYGVTRFMGAFPLLARNNSETYAARYGKTITEDLNYDGTLEKLNVQIAVAEVTVSYGEKLSVHYELPENLIPKISFENGELVIREKSGIKITQGISAENYKMEIVLPKDCKLESGDVEVDCGSIRMKEILAEKLIVDADCGNVELEGLTGTTLEISADVGNVELKNMTYDKVTIDADCGNVSSVGGKYDTLDCDVDLGKFELLEATFRSAKCDNNMGNITVEGTFDRLEADCDMGSVEIRTTKPEEEVQLILNVDMGSITVNGKKR